MTLPMIAYMAATTLSFGLFGFVCFLIGADKYRRQVRSIETTLSAANTDRYVAEQRASRAEISARIAKARLAELQETAFVRDGNRFVRWMTLNG